MLDDDSNWNELDEEAKQTEKFEASDDCDSGEGEHEGLEGYLDYIEGILSLLCLLLLCYCICTQWCSHKFILV